MANETKTLVWTRKVFGKSRTYTTTGYKIDYRQVLSSKPSYTLYLDDTNGTYLGTFWNLEFAKKNAERHQQTGKIIGQNALASI